MKNHPSDRRLRSAIPTTTLYTLSLPLNETDRGAVDTRPRGHPARSLSERATYRTLVSSSSEVTTRCCKVLTVRRPSPAVGGDAGPSSAKHVGGCIAGVMKAAYVPGRDVGKGPLATTAGWAPGSMLTGSVPACGGWSPPPLRGAAFKFACWVAQLRQIRVIVSPRGPKLEQLPRQGQLRCCLPSRSHLKPPLAKPPPYKYANYHQHGRHHGSDRSRSHSVAPLAQGRDTVALDGPAPARASPTVGCAQLPHLTWQ
jgi:hypothetical protein